MLIQNKALLKPYETRIWQGIPAVECTKSGRTFVAFYSGGMKEELGNFVLLTVADRFDGDYRLIAVADTPGRRCYDPCLWIDPQGRLWLIWAEMPEHCVMAAVCEDPEAEEPVFSAPRRVGEDVWLNKPEVLPDGAWVFPGAIWGDGVRTMGPEYDTQNTPTGAFAAISRDGGKTFRKGAAVRAKDRSFDENMILRLKDGRLWMLIRTHYGIAETFSADEGETWSEPVPSPIPGPDSRFCLRRLPSGRILLINHIRVEGKRRNNLAALLSEDEGKTFPYSLMLDERGGVSYPDVAFEPDGSLLVAYDRERGCFKKTVEEAERDAREILLAHITEEDILQGRPGEGSRLRVIVNKL